ncbi:hypothetical protein ACSBR2_010784 [Camellia fascicularis]
MSWKALEQLVEFIIAFQFRHPKLLLFLGHHLADFVKQNFLHTNLEDYVVKKAIYNLLLIIHLKLYMNC